MHLRSASIPTHPLLQLYRASRLQSSSLMHSYAHSRVNLSASSKRSLRLLLLRQPQPQHLHPHPVLVLQALWLVLTEQLPRVPLPGPTVPPLRVLRRAPARGQRAARVRAHPLRVSRHLPPVEGPSQACLAIHSSALQSEVLADRLAIKALVAPMRRVASGSRAARLVPRALRPPQAPARARASPQMAR